MNCSTLDATLQDVVQFHHSTARQIRAERSLVVALLLLLVVLFALLLMPAVALGVLGVYCAAYLIFGALWLALKGLGWLLDRGL